MKKHKRLLLSSALVLGTLASQQVAQADSNNPADKASAVNVSLSGSRASIEYYRSRAQVPYTIYHAVWSEEDGQDDIKWYVAPQTPRMSVNLSDHKGSGRFQVHTYINVNGKMIGLNATSVYLDKYAGSSTSTSPIYRPTPVTPTRSTEVSTSFPSQGIMDVLITNPPSNISELLIPTWSDNNGQDDIKWYKATKNPNGSYSLRIYLRDHKYDTGTYHLHVYSRNYAGSLQSHIGTTATVTSDNIPTVTPTPSASVNASITYSGNGIFRTNIDNVTSYGTVSYAVWSDQNGQDDIKWYNASKSGYGSYIGDIDLKNHKNSGTYHLHVYQNGVGLAVTTFQVDDSQLPAQPTPQPIASRPSTGSNTYPVGQCTWGVKELAPWIPNYLGNAGGWTEAARRQGFRTGSTPQVGAIACWNGGYGGYGHVALVTEVQSNNRIQVKECNYAGRQYISNFRGWFDPTATSEGSISYIYPD